MRPSKNIEALKAIILFLVLSWSCVEFEPVSLIPQVSFKSFDVVDAINELNQPIKSAKLEFNFIDGDADFGVFKEVHNNLNLPDSFRYGLFIDLYEKIDQQYKIRYFTQFNDSTQEFDTIRLHQWIVYDEKLDRVGQNKTVKGIIRVDIQLEKPEELKDTFRLEFFIRDRALNKSNIATTQDYLIEQ